MTLQSIRCGCHMSALLVLQCRIKDSSQRQVRAVPVQAGKMCNHRGSPNRHLSSIPRNSYGPANMQCAGRATAHKESLVNGKLEDRLMSAAGKLHRGMLWPVKVRYGPFM